MSNSTFPSRIDDFPDPSAVTPLSGGGMTSLAHARQHKNINDAVEAIEQYIGRPAPYGVADSSTFSNVPTLESRINTLETVGGPLGYTGSIGPVGYTGSRGTSGYTGSMPVLPVATEHTLGCVKVGDGLEINTSDVLSVQKATSMSIGGIIVGAGLEIDTGGVLSVIGAVGSSTGGTGTGTTGFTGSQGIQGPIGYTGSAGSGSGGGTGYTGSQGAVGYTGSAGSGSGGGTGYTGSQGVIGYTGSKGDPGAASTAPVSDNAVGSFALVSNQMDGSGVPVYGQSVDLTQFIMQGPGTVSYASQTLSGTWKARGSPYTSGSQWPGSLLLIQRVA